MKKFFTLLLFLPILFSMNKVQAQSRFAVTLQGGYGNGGYEATHTGIGFGKFAFRVDVSYTFLPILDAYAAYSRTGFAVDANSTWLASTPNFTTSGFNLGLRLNHGPNASIWIPWLRAGLTYGILKWEAEGDSYSGSGLGFEVGAGLAYPVTEHIKIVPSVNYTRYSITSKKGYNNAVVVLTALIGARYEF